MNDGIITLYGSREQVLAELTSKQQVPQRGHARGRQYRARGCAPG